MPKTETKAEFARRLGVSRARISQMIGDGTIGPDALKGEGRGAEIVIDLAKTQIAQRRHPGQALGNGLNTKVAGGGAALGADHDDDLARQLQLERLEADQRKNRIAAREEAVALEQLVPVDQVRAEMGRMAQAIEDANAGMLTDFASAIAGQHGISQRDMLHLLHKVRNEKRAQFAERAKQRAEATPPTVEFSIETGPGNGSSLKEKG